MLEKRFLLFIITYTIIYYIIILIIILYTDIIDLDNIFVNTNSIDKTLNYYNSVKEITINCENSNTLIIKNTKPCIFSPFIDLFSKENSSYVYYPSYFVSNNIKYEKNEMDLLEFIIYNQFNILDNNISATREYIQNTNIILGDYITIVGRILNIVNTQ
jgi:hypothetical protein